MTIEEWTAELNAPLYQRKGKVSPKVAEEELAMFKRAQAILQG